MEKEENIKKLKKKIKKIEKMIDDLKWIEIDTMGAIQIENLSQIRSLGENTLAELKRLKYYYEEELKALQEINENTTNL